MDYHHSKTTTLDSPSLLDEGNYQNSRATYKEPHYETISGEDGPEVTIVRKKVPRRDPSHSSKLSEDYLASSSRSHDSGSPTSHRHPAMSKPQSNRKPLQGLNLGDSEEQENVNDNEERQKNHDNLDESHNPLEDSVEIPVTRQQSYVDGGYGEDSFPSEQFPHDPEFTASYNPQTRERFRRKLRYFFMNPLDKWKAKGKLPWKLGLQVVKIIVVTLQILIFGSHMSKYLNHQGNMVITFRELFMSDWDPVREVMTYPPTAGPYAVYTKQDFYKHVNNAIGVYASITESAIGLFGYAHNVSHDNPMSPITLCKEHYLYGRADPSAFYYNYSNVKHYDCLDIVNKTMLPGDPGWEHFDVAAYLDHHNFTIYFDRIIRVVLMFPLRTIYLNTLDPSDEPDCYAINITITYDNTLHDGQTLINLNSINHRRPCNGRIDHSDNYRKTYEIATLNVLVILLSTLSLLLCTRSIYRANKLRVRAVVFFKENFGKELSFNDQMNFVDFWIVMIVINDILIIAGSVLKLMIEKRIFESIYFPACSLLLGVGNLLVWMGLLRYLGFFRKYNVLILTMKRAVPHVLRFSLCAVLLYGGFCLCGWLVLGPYHIKFKLLSTTSECLFSLLNGDDMFATFEALDAKGDPLIWWFSRIYLYCFISLFIYIILSLFISIIMDAYDTIKNYYETGFPLTDFQKFITECPDDYQSSQFASERENSARFDVTATLRTAVNDLWDRLRGSSRNYGRRATYQRI